MNNTKVYFLNEENKISWHYADIITIQNRQYGLQIHESGMFTAYDVPTGQRIGKFEHLIELVNKINSDEFQKVLDSEEYTGTRRRLRYVLTEYFKESQ